MRDNMSSLKKRQHYVWRKYLLSWATNEKIWCKRNKDIFRSNLTGVAVESYFYRLQELKEEQIEILQALFINNSDPIMQKLNQGWIDLLTVVFKLRHLSEKYGKLTPKIHEEFQKAEINLEEELHGHIEQNALPYLDLLQKGNTAFYDDIEDNISFNIFLATQYMRTKNMRTNFIRNIEKMKFDLPQYSIYYEQLTAGNPDSVWGITRHILATNLAANLYLNRDNISMILLKNDTSIRLITGDQPVINTFAVGLNSFEPPEKLELYYPITPKIAILIKETSQKSNPTLVMRLGEKDVLNYNQMIIEQSHEQIFSVEETDLKREHS